MSESVYVPAETCSAFSFFNKVRCQLAAGHDGPHIHEYGNGHLCGWENRDD